MGGILILLLVFGVIHFLSNKFHYKAVVMCGIYLGILLVATVVFYFVPSNDGEVGSEALLDEAAYDREISQFYDDLYEGNVDEMDATFLEERLEYTVEGKQLSIEADLSDSGSMVVIERTTNQDQKVEAFLYKTKTYIDNRDMTDQVRNMSVEWNRDTLSVKKPEEMSIKRTLFQDEFTITQFNGERNTTNDAHYASYLGEGMLYLRIPNDVEIVTDSEDYIYYVE